MRFRSWRKSSRSNGSSDCVEVAATVDAAVVGVRDSKQPGPQLTLPAGEWQALCHTLTR